MRKTTPTIAIISDFGTKDWYGASMVGSLLKHCPNAQVVTVTHEIPPGDIGSASFLLASCIRDFPASTIFICVVDPGVGTERKAMMGRIFNYTIIGPDNGLISDCARQFPQEVGKFYEVLPEKSPSDLISSTFHGRDVFAPVAGKVASGDMKLEELGIILPDPIRLELPNPEIRKGVINGTVRYIDVFGNAITNISQTELTLFKLRASAYLELKGNKIPLRTTFGESEVGQPLTYVGSNGFLEIAINSGNAAEKLNIKVGQSVAFHPYTDDPGDEPNRGQTRLIPS